jgi:hypothetical protein
MSAVAPIARSSTEFTAGRRAYRDLAAVLALSVLTLIVESDLLRGEPMIGMDTGTAFYPWYSFLGDRLRSGHIPLWNPHQFSGAPFAADPESGWMYLPAMLLFTVLPLDAAAKSYMALHPLLAGLSVYALARTLEMRVAGALLAATSYAATGFLYGHHICCFAYAGVAAWLPLTLLGAELAIRGRRWPTTGLGWGVGGLGLSQILGTWLGQGSYYALLALGGYVAYRTVLLPPSTVRGIRPRLVGFMLHAGGLLLFGFGLAAAGILPRLEYNALSNLPGGYPDPGTGVDLSAPTDWRSVRDRVLLVLTPGFHYAGGATLGLALMAPLLAGARFAVPYFAALSLGTLILSIEGSTPLQWALSLLPAFDQLHHHAPGRILTVFYLGPALLAGATLNCLAEGHRRAAVAALVAALVAGLAALGMTVTLPVSAPALGALASASGLVAAGALLPALRPLASALLLLVVCTDLLVARHAVVAEGAVVPAYDIRQTDLASCYEPTSAGRFLLSQGEPGGIRYFGTAQHVYGGPFPYTLRWADPNTTALEVNNRAMISGLHDIQGYNPIHIARYDEYMTALNGRPQDYHHADVFEQGLASPLLDLLNARYVVVPAVPAPDQTAMRLDPPYRTVYEDDRVRVLENPKALPRAWIVHAALRVEPGQALEALASGMVDPSLVALLEGPPPSLAQPEDASADGAAITAYDADRLELRTRTDAPGLLVLSEVYYPAWKAYVDDAPAPLYLANHVLRAVPVPAGEHRVELRYESPALLAGMVISLGMYWILLGLAIAAGVQRRKCAFSVDSAAAH